MRAARSASASERRVPEGQELVALGPVRSASSRSDGFACSSSEYSDESESCWGFLMSSPRSYAAAAVVFAGSESVSKASRTRLKSERGAGLIGWYFSERRR